VLRQKQKGDNGRNAVHGSVKQCSAAPPMGVLIVLSFVCACRPMKFFNVHEATIYVVVECKRSRVSVVW